ncbi:MAG: helix-turn-helix domain-containing protein [Pseudomonadota bacterium]
MEKICLARRTWQNDNNDAEKGSQLPFPLRPESSILIKPPELIQSLVEALGIDFTRPETVNKKFSLEVQCNSHTPFNVVVNVKPAGPERQVRWLTPQETAQALKVSKHTVYKQLTAGALKGKKIGRQWRILADESDKETRGDL